MFYKEDLFGDKIKRLYVNGERKNSYFYGHQGDLIIEEVDTNNGSLVLSSFLKG